MSQTITTAAVTPIFMSDLHQLDFSMVKLKLQDTEEGLGWSAAQCDDAENEYKKFLAMKRTYPEKDIVPNKMVDLFWHQHILDTQKYAMDCEEIFGYFLHHFPYFGMKDEQDLQNLNDAFEDTQKLYAMHFHETLTGEAPKCKAPKCRTACKPMKCK